MGNYVYFIFDLEQQRRCLSWNEKPEDGPALGPVLGPDTATVGVDNGAADRKAETRP
jgi:hypothetical protein